MYSLYSLGNRLLQYAKQKIPQSGRGGLNNTCFLAKTLAIDVVVQINKELAYRVLSLALQRSLLDFSGNLGYEGKKHEAQPNACQSASLSLSPVRPLS